MFAARTERILSPSQLEASVDLGFGIGLRRAIELEDFAGPRVQDVDLYDAARHCLILLAGSRRLILQPDPRNRDRWSYMRLIPARVYVIARFQGQPVGLIENFPGANGPVLEITPFMRWLGHANFDISLVKNTLRGPPDGTAA